MTSPAPAAADVFLSGRKVAHEVGAFERMRRNGWPAPKIAEFFKMKPSRLVVELQRDIDLEEAAKRRGRPIHAGTVRGVR